MLVEERKQGRFMLPCLTAGTSGSRGFGRCRRASRCCVMAVCRLVAAATVAEQSGAVLNEAQDAFGSSCLVLNTSVELLPSRGSFDSALERDAGEDQ